jgi:DNA invertase Pin-like site-specific DNA recombinase
MCTRVTACIAASIYARVSTLDQQPENQLGELRCYMRAREWTLHDEFIDRGVSGSKDRRPELERMLGDAKLRRFDVLLCWKLDRLGRNLKHLVTMLDDLQALRVAFVSLGEGIDATTPAGRLQMHLLAAIAEFERGRIVERVRAGLARAKADGKRLGRPRKQLPHERIRSVAQLSLDGGSAALGISRATLKRWRRDLFGTAVSSIRCSFGYGYLVIQRQVVFEAFPSAEHCLGRCDFVGLALEIELQG